MAPQKKYLHDKLMLLLASINIFLALLCVFLVTMRLGIGQGGGGYIVQYRANLGISAFKTGGVSSLLSFIGFVIIVSTTNIWLSIAAYKIRRELATVVLNLGILLLLLAIIVSNGLLILR